MVLWRVVWFIILGGLASPNPFSFAVANWPCGHLAEWFHVVHTPTVKPLSYVASGEAESIASLLEHGADVHARGDGLRCFPARLRLIYHGNVCSCNCLAVSKDPSAGVPPNPATAGCGREARAGHVFLPRRCRALPHQAGDGEDNASCREQTLLEVRARLSHFETGNGPHSSELQVSIRLPALQQALGCPIYAPGFRIASHRRQRRR